MPQKPTANRLSLVQKLILSYAAIAFFSMAATAFSIYGLHKLNGVVRDIARNDFSSMKSVEGLRDSLFAQERNAAKYSVLNSPEFRDLYYQRQKEFLSSVKALSRSGNSGLLDTLSRDYQEFAAQAEHLFRKNNGDIQPLKKSAEKVHGAIDNLYAVQQTTLNSKLQNADMAREMTVKWTALMTFGGLLFALCVMVLFVYTISSAIKKLKQATQRIAEGNFDYDHQIPPGDEIGDLAQEFTTMAARLKVLEQMSLDASPLTRLPGNIAIERVLTKKLQADETFAVCYADLDNFKAYSDRYGYIKGSDLIKMTGEVIYEVVRRLTDEDAFVGHIGGDDFVMIIPSDDVDTVCSAVIQEFTRRVPEYYSAEDLAKGSIDAVDRYGVERVFPIMTISIAVVMCSKGEYDSAVKIARTAAEIKEFAKGAAGSNYFIDRRKKAR